MQDDVKFHGLSEYVVTFHKICSFDNNVLKIQRNVYFFQGYRQTSCNRRRIVDFEMIIFSWFLSSTFTNATDFRRLIMTFCCRMRPVCVLVFRLWSRPFKFTMGFIDFYLATMCPLASTLS